MARFDRVERTAARADAVLRVTVSNFLADGGDGFTVLRDGTRSARRAIDRDALEAYFTAHSPVGPLPRDRIARAGG